MRHVRARVVQVLGPEGGRLKAGGHAFTVRITMEVVWDTVRSGAEGDPT